MKYNIQYRLKRWSVRARQKRRFVREQRILNMLDREQRAVYDLVIKTAKNHPDKILYDTLTEEILIVEKTRLFTLFNANKERIVSIHNHKGFHNQWFPETAFDHLTSIVNREAHRYRRGLKYDVRMNIRSFIESVSSEQDSSES